MNIRHGKDPARALLEAVALEGYRSDRLSENDVRELLGFDTRIEVHGFLKENGVFLHYTRQDLAHDMEAAKRYEAPTRANLPGELTAG